MFILVKAGCFPLKPLSAFLIHLCRLRHRRCVFMCQHVCISNNADSHVDTQYEQAASFFFFFKGKRVRTTAVGTVLWWCTGIFVIVWWFNPRPQALSSHLPRHIVPTHTHTHISSHSCLVVDASANQYVQFWRNTALPWQPSLLSYREENCKLYSLVLRPIFPHLP